MFHLQDMGRSLVLKYTSSFASPFSQDVHHGSMMPGVWRTISYDYDAKKTMEHHDECYDGYHYDGCYMVDDQNIGWIIIIITLIIIIIPTESNKIPSFSQQDHHFPWFLFYGPEMGASRAAWTCCCCTCCTWRGGTWVKLGKIQVAKDQITTRNNITNNINNNIAKK